MLSRNTGGLGMLTNASKNEGKAAEFYERFALMIFVKVKTEINQKSYKNTQR